MKNKLSSLRVLWLLLLIALFCHSNEAQELLPKNEKPKSLTSILVDNRALPIAERIVLYQDYKITNASKTDLEDEMNMFGYSLLWDKQVEDAIEIFKVIVTDYPNSANAYDSLAEAYQSAGSTDLAISNYEKSLSLNPDNFNAEDQISILKNPDVKILKSSEKFDVKYSVIEYREDLDQLLNTLLEVHPNALKFISREELEKVVNEKKEMINEQTTYAEFVWYCDEIVANINCSHTSIGSFYQSNEMLPTELHFPLQTRLVDDRLYVIDPWNNQNVDPSDQIMTINGVSVKNIMQEIYKHIPSQGYIQTSKRHIFNRYSTSMIPFALGFPQEYNIEVKGKDAAITLNRAEFNNDPLRDQSMTYCGDNLCIEYVDTEKKIAILTISSFNYYEWNNLKVFQRFIDDNMADIYANQTEYLIIDVRKNGGGSSESSMHLLKYLMDKPFVYLSKAEFEGKTEPVEGEKEQIPFDTIFKGKIYFLIDGNGTSTTGHFMSIAKDQNLGIIIGEELGSNQFCSAGQKPCRLRNTKLKFYVANNTHVSSADSLPDEVGILPDHYVSQSVTDYLQGNDVVKQYALDLIAEETEWQSASIFHSSYFLEADSTWRKELFRIPLNFAPSITLRGMEDARFPVGWEIKDSITFWSYVFAWNVVQPQALTVDDLSDNLELYFNGLMHVEERGKEYGISESTANFQIVETSEDIIYYTGEIKTLDGFFERKPMTFHVKAEQHYCQEIGRAIVLFRFSPQGFHSRVWDKLQEVVIPTEICDK